jgi:DNA-binding NarL/FixJ family response regulator
MSTAKPEISVETIAKWQKVVELIARLAGVPSSLIMKTDAPLHSVLVSNRDAESPYRTGQSFRLNERLYCHGVLSHGGELVVEDATTDPVWCDNDDMEFGMSFYVGYPLKWPDGAVFGTICVLDRRRNEQALLFREGLKEFCRVIETDLALLLEAERRRAAEVALQATLAGLERTVAESTRDLEEANAALRVLIANLEHARRDYEEELRRKIRSLVRPSVAKLRHGIGMTEPHRTHIDVIEANLKSLLGRRAAGLAEVYERLTPAEVEVAQLVIHGYSTKDIANRMSRGTSTIDFHRNNIRRKLNLGRKANLRSYLTSLQLYGDNPHIPPP